MKKFMWLSLLWLSVFPLFGQFRGGFGRSPGHAFGAGRQPVIRFGFAAPRANSGFFDLGLPAVGPIPFLDSRAPRFRRQPGAFAPLGFGGFAYPFYAESDYGYAQSAPTVILVQPPAVAAPAAPPPPPPVKPVIHDYKHAAPPEGHAQAFAIALRDGTVHSAIAAWVQDNNLHYIEPDGRGRQAPLASVDRSATERLNRERNLTLPLPPPDQG